MIFGGSFKIKMIVGVSGMIYTQKSGKLASKLEGFDLHNKFFKVEARSRLSLVIEFEGPQFLICKTGERHRCRCLCGRYGIFNSIR